MEVFYEIMDAMQIMDYIIMAFLGIISYFLRDVHAGMKEHKKESELQHLHFSEEVGKLKGKIEMVQQQANNDITRIEQITQLKLDQISKDVAELTKVIQQLLKSKL
jgi:ferritin-like metal-binding protein YciE